MHILSIGNVAFMAFGQPVSWIEIFGVITGFLSVLYAARENIWTWSTGLLNALAFGIIFWQVQLYADVALQVFYVVVTFYGWYTWLHPKTKETTNSVGQLKVTGFTNKQRLIAVGGLLVATAIAGTLFKAVPDWFTTLFPKPTAFPYWDSYVLVGSVVAFILLSKKLKENWLLYLSCDLISIVLYSIQGIYLVAFEYVFFAGLCSYGLPRWYKGGTK